MRYQKSRKKFKKIVVLLLLIAIETVIVIWQQGLEKVEEECYQPVGRLVEVNSHQVHMVEKGKGKPIVVFLTGSGTPCAYTDFYLLQQELSKSAKTITFDRPGFGWSEKTQVERTIDHQVMELEKILSYTSKAKSYVLVAHSLASLEALRFAQQYPEQVKGIVFLDCGSPEFYKEDSETKSVAINRACAFLRVSGLNRLVSGLVKPSFVGEDIRYKNLPEELKKLDLSMYNRFLGDSDNLENILMMNENAETVLSNKKKMDIPFLVLSSDQDTGWTETQKQLGEWSTNYQQIVLKDSSHYIHWSNTDEVIALINDFIKDKH